MSFETDTALMAKETWNLVYETKYSGDEDLTAAIVYAVADAKGIDPLDLDANLYDVVDISAIDSPFGTPVSENPKVRGSLEFEFAGSRVFVTSDGSIQIFDKSGH